MGSEYLKRGGDPEGFAKSLQRAQLGAENDVDYDDDQGKYFGRRPSFVDDNDVNDEASGQMGAAAEPLALSDSSSATTRPTRMTSSPIASARNR